MDRQLGQAAQRASGSFNQFNSNLSGSLTGLLSVGAALGVLKTGLGIVSDFDRLDAGLKAVSKSTADFAQTQEFLRGLSNSLGVSYQTLAESYKGLKASTNGTNLEGRATEKIFASVVRAGAALKLSNDDIRGSLLALQQMMSKGTVSAEELRGQLGERLSGAFRLAANAMGVTEQKLGKMLEQGQVMAADLLPRLAAELDKTYGQKAQDNVNTMAGGWARLTSETGLFISEFAKTSGIDTFFSKLYNGMANMISSLRTAITLTGSIFGTYKQFNPEFQKKLDTFKEADRPGKQKLFDQNRRDLRINEKFQQGILNGSDPYSEASTRMLRQLESEKRDLLIAQREMQKIARSQPADSIIKPFVLKAKAPKATGSLKESVGLDFDKDLLSRLIAQRDALTASGKKVPDSLLNSIDALTRKIEGAANAFKRLDLDGSIGRLAIRGGTAVGRLESAIPQGQSIVNKGVALSANGNVDPEAFGLKDKMDQSTASNNVVIDNWIANFKENQSRVKEAADDMARVVAEAKIGLKLAGADFLAGFGESLAKSENPLKDGLKAIVGIISDYIIQLGTALLIGSATMFAASPFTGGLTLPKAIGWKIAGAGLIVGGGALKAAAFAEGGGVSDATYALIGEGRGTNRQNPELAVPANKLRSYIMDMAPKSGSKAVHITGRISGQDLDLIQRRANRANEDFLM